MLSINVFDRFAHAKQDGSEYFILLIITDGCICDMDSTKEAIVQVSQFSLDFEMFVSLGLLLQVFNQRYMPVCFVFERARVPWHFLLVKGHPMRKS